MINKKILEETSFNFFNTRISAKELAILTLKKVYGEDLSVDILPINPFKILTLSGAKYTLLNLDKIEGIYILPENNEYGYIGLNKNRPVERIRFSAAHELCHHLKDTESSKSLQSDNDIKEKYANSFASELLIPTKILKEVSKNIQFVSITHNIYDFLNLSNIFGVSLQALVIKFCSVYNFNYDKNEYKKISRKIKPNNEKKKLDINYHKTLYSQIIDSYKFEIIKSEYNTKLKNDLLRFIITSDHEMENGNVSKERISEILALLRIYGTDLIHEHITSPDELEVVGEYLMYQALFKYDKGINLVELLINLHKTFYSCAPYPEFGGIFRNTNARIADTLVSTTQHHLIQIELIDIFDSFNRKTSFGLSTTSKFVKEICKLHHGLTIIHPFNDGNGRTIRAFTNFQLLQNGISPYYITDKDKQEYKESLSKMDTLYNQNPTSDYFEVFIYKRIIDMYDYFLSQSFVNSDTNTS